MKEDKNFLEKAINSLKNEQIPPGPPKELAEATIEKLNRASEQLNAVEFDQRLYNTDRIIMFSSLIKFAAAAVLLIITGFAVGKLTTTQPPDMEQIRATLEPAIRDQLLDEMKQHMQLGLANSYVQLKDDMTEQYHRDMNQLAANIVTASGTMTNQLLEDLIESIYTTQTQERQRFAAALEQIEMNRRQDKAQLSNAVMNLAVQTEDQLIRTQQDVEQLRSYTQPSRLDSGRFGDSDI